MIALEENVTYTSLTLGQRLADGPIPLPEALRYATLLAEALREIHDSGRTYGALQPSNINITATGLELIATPDQRASVTNYTAPEILQGYPGDARSDVFAFGAIFYEMVTGCRAFSGDTADAVAVSLAISVPPLSGNPAIDHLISNCVAKDPAVRCQRMQTVILELKLLTFATPEAVTRQQVAMAALRAETRQLETNLAGLLQCHEKSVSEMQRASTDAINELSGRLSNVESELAPVQARILSVEQGTEALTQRMNGLFEQVEQRMQAIDERLASLKDGIEVLTQGATVLQECLGSRLQEFEHTVKSQRTSIASVVAGQRQTDDVVERIVAALELLQSSVYDSVEEPG